MRLFNLEFHLQENTPTEGVCEVNAYTVPEAMNEGLEGKLEGLSFYVEISDLIFHVTQGEDFHFICYVPKDAKSMEDYIQCYDSDPYEGTWNNLEEYLNPLTANLLKGVWLYSIDNSIPTKKFITHVCA